MTPAEVCSYLRGRLQMKVQALENGQYALSPLPRDTGGKSWDPECWDLPELCAHYGIPIWKVGLAPAPLPATGDVFAAEMGPAPPGTRPCLEMFEGMVCTREQGHERVQGPAGDHAAHDLHGEMVKRWPSASVAASEVGT